MFGKSRDAGDAGYEALLRKKQEMLASLRAESDRIKEGFQIQAKAAELEAIERKPALMALAEADHADDKKNYFFQCKRHGDFLALFITRRCLIRRKGVEPESRECKWSTTVNLGKTTKLSLSDGNAPDFTSTLAYGFSLESNSSDPESEVIWSGTMRHPEYPSIILAAPKGMHYVVKPRYPVIMGARWPHAYAGGEICILDDSAGPYGYYRNADHNDSVPGFDDSVPGFVTKDYVNPAHDDVLTFVGTNVSINMPGGTGGGIREAIHLECGRAWGVALRAAAVELK